ncbi:glycine betaine ABC transporter substrate-binding protein [Paeniglutamicibacter antarcticus]|uniref:Glycine betaine ABC transporter substrate-binding protein n=1 Tax=Arthrobacter terrae TaxID=2935737 RepID=A0A931CGJ8_9MICC|nr:glycine betaine ABC transporter substrate-binding protein [Arthrobacter terrae]MBG0737958.1 glycine betaine ABC transporter substrate-binding protein [Arthrobacter terrae]
MKNRFRTLAAIVVVGMLGLTACSGTADAAKLDNGDNKDLNIAVFNGWDEDTAASELWKAVLEDKGYNVKLTYADTAPVYLGLSTDDYDLVLDTWLPNTHKTYIEQYGADMTDLGVWNEDAQNAIAVNKDAPIDSLDELAANADKFGNKIVGIEPSAGLTELTEKAIKAYGLEKMDFVTSSTPAMLSELTAATNAKENIAVTLWSPHWAYDAFPVKNLKDPKNIFGDSEGIHSFGSKSFEKNFPTLSGWIKGFKMDSDKLFSLENVMFNTGTTVDDYAPIVKKWMSENKDYVDELSS